jgi:hypothetical protein
LANDGGGGEHTFVEQEAMIGGLNDSFNRIDEFMSACVARIQNVAYCPARRY